MPEDILVHKPMHTKKISAASALRSIPTYPTMSSSRRADTREDISRMGELRRIHSASIGKLSLQPYKAFPFLDEENALNWFKAASSSQVPA
ncbi:MAG: hypothetical protein ABJA60_12265 [Nitrosospira sp.]